jgi:lysosomal alpha-mannosidase
MDFYFGKQDPDFEGKIMEKVIVHVSIDPELDVLKFEVDLGSLPNAAYDGHEVVVNFHVDNFFNNQTFYTDSNGLDMQKRILNFRPTWDIQLDYNDSNRALNHTNDNITANFYPINSAISMKDIYSERVFTVMNDRS